MKVKRMKTRILWGALALAFAMIGFTGCPNGNNGNDNGITVPTTYTLSEIRITGMPPLATPEGPNPDAVVFMMVSALVGTPPASEGMGAAVADGAIPGLPVIAPSVVEDPLSDVEVTTALHNAAAFMAFLIAVQTGGDATMPASIDATVSGTGVIQIGFVMISDGDVIIPQHTRTWPVDFSDIENGVLEINWGGCCN